MNILLETATNPVSTPASVSLALVGIVGFIAAATLGSISWYNSRRPLGWEDKERPPIVPEVDDSVGISQE